MKRLSELDSPALAGVVHERTAAAAIAEMKNCLFDGADMIDLHISCLEKRRRGNAATDYSGFAFARACFKLQFAIRLVGRGVFGRRTRRVVVAGGARDAGVEKGN